MYNILNSETKTNTECKFLCGDFNCTIGDSHVSYPNHIGAFGKNKTSKNGKLLVDFLTQNNLYASNTLFKHKLAHVTTFTLNLKIKSRKNPIRKQILY